MNKIIVSDSDWFRGENILVPLYYGMENLCAGKTLIKYASENSEASQYIKKFCKPEEGKTKFLVHAVAAGEFYSANRNGDYFPEKDLIAKHNTFVTNGHVYKLHANKDPKKKFGDVEKSFYNPRMHRVELVISIDNSKSPEILSKWNNGEDLSVSMACFVKSDFCSICKHESPKVKDYCKHLKEQMGDILEDGRQVCAINYDPTFFDISFVGKPAERVAYVLSKAAACNPQTASSAELALLEPDRFDKVSTEKEALISKLSEIEKKLEGLIVAKDNRVKKDAIKVHGLPELPRKALEKLHKSGTSAATKALSDRGIHLSFPEFIKMITGKLDDKHDTPESLPGSISKGKVPEDSTKFDVGKSTSGLFPDLHKILDSFMGERSLFKLPAARRSIQIIIIGGGDSKKDPEFKEKKASDSSYEDSLVTAYNAYRLAACEYVERTKCAEDAESFEILSILSGYLI